MEVTQLNSFDNCFSATFTVALTAGVTALTVQQVANSTKKVRFLSAIAATTTNGTQLVVERYLTGPGATTTALAIVNMNAANPLAQTSTCQAFSASNITAGTPLFYYTAGATAGTTAVDLSFLDLESSVFDSLTIRVASNVTATIGLTLVWREF